MGSSGDVTTKKLRDRHGKKQQAFQRKNKTQREEIVRLQKVMYKRDEKHQEDLLILRDKIVATGREMQAIMEGQARAVDGFIEAHARLERGFLSRLCWALGVAWRGRFE